MQHMHTVCLLVMDSGAVLLLRPVGGGLELAVGGSSLVEGARVTWDIPEASEISYCYMYSQPREVYLRRY